MEIQIYDKNRDVDSKNLHAIIFLCVCGRRIADSRGCYGEIGREIHGKSNHVEGEIWKRKHEKEERVEKVM